MSDGIFSIFFTPQPSCSIFINYLQWFPQSWWMLSNAGNCCYDPSVPCLHVQLWRLNLWKTSAAGKERAKSQHTWEYVVLWSWGLWNLILHVNMRMNRMYLLKLIVLIWKTGFAVDVWITKDGYSSSSFISAILIQVKYVTEHWVFITPWMVFHWTTLCKCCYCYCQVLQNESEDSLVQLTLKSTRPVM